jgi:hypothetical protein
MEGTCTYYADLDGNGRADQHLITETFNNEAITYFSPSCGLVDVTGDGAVMDGDLSPVPSGSTTPKPSTPAPVPADNCQLQRFMSLGNGMIGNMETGVTICDAKWNRGVSSYFTEARADKDALRYLRIKFTDGSEVERGAKVAIDSHYCIGSMTWDPFRNSFNELSFWAGGWNGGIGRIVMVMPGKERVNAEKYWDNPPPEYKLDRGRDGLGMLMGFLTNSGDAIDAIQPMFSSAGPDKVVLRDAIFESQSRC